MFRQRITKTGEGFSIKRVVDFIKDYEMENPTPGNIECHIIDDAFTFRDTKTNEGITLTKTSIIVLTKYHTPTEEHENCFESTYLSNLYGDLILSVPEAPSWDIYDEYVWHHGVEGFAEAIAKKEA